MIQPLNVMFDGKMDWFSFVVTIYRKPCVSPVNVFTRPAMCSFIQFWESWNSTRIIPSGERLHSNEKIHHAFNGKIHYFYGHFQLLFVSSQEGNHNNLQKGFMFVLNSSKVWIISPFSDKPLLHIVGDCWIVLSYRMFPNKTPINWVVGGFNLPGKKCQWGSSTPGWTSCPTSSICDILRISSTVSKPKQYRNSEQGHHFFVKFTGWWYTYPSEKYESQLGLLFPIDGKS